MKRQTIVMAVVMILLVVAVAPEANGGGGTPITSCAQTVTTSAFLTRDLTCGSTSGVVVGANGITIRLEGVHPPRRRLVQPLRHREQRFRRGDNQERRRTQLQLRRLRGQRR